MEMTMTMTNTMTKRYSELIALTSFIDRFNYLKLEGVVGQETFGIERYLNQEFYHSEEWKSIRDRIIIRDGGCDLGIPGREIHGRIYIHHMNPILPEDVIRHSSTLVDPENLICTSKRTHDAIHYGDENQLAKDPVVRCKNDTCPWRR